MKGIKKLVAMGIIVSTLFMAIGCESVNDNIEAAGDAASDMAADLPLSEKGSSEMQGHRDGKMWAKKSSFNAKDVIELFIIHEKTETLLAKDYFSAVLEHISFNGMEDDEALESLLEGYVYYTENPEELETNK